MAKTWYPVIDYLTCVECGTCSFICPARVQLVQRFKVGKQLVREEQAKIAARTQAKGAQ